ncbi:MAG: PPC domain-containing protein [Anaerolineae bacterium]|jgi:hypothetical protein|nr:PPC domain-containing protein [Anaerolineae bacterium]
MKNKHLFWIGLLLYCLITPLSAQSDDGEVVLFNQIVTGRIDNLAPYQTYFFEALRCDFISIKVTTTQGDLDPIISVMNSDGSLVAYQDDANGGEDNHLRALAIPNTGQYTLIISRFGYDLGTTAGNYELLIERIGNGSGFGCALRYGDTVFQVIDNQQPEVFYSFRARLGDLINVTMRRRSGNLDPYIRLIDSNNQILTENDDVPGTDTAVASLEAFFIPADGTYYIQATRYGFIAGQSTGNFSLSITEAENSGIGNSALGAIPIEYNTTIEGEITNNQLVRYYRFSGRENDIITIAMSRLDGNLDTYISLTSATLDELANNDDLSNETQNSRITDFRIPATGTYYLVATRYQGATGTTTGKYRLQLQSQGNAFESVASDVRRILYGVSLTGNIDDITREVWYTFYGEVGDVISLTMDRVEGNLDPYIELYAEDRQSILAADDDSGGGANNARVDRFTLGYTGIYYIRATRYFGDDNPNTSGSFVLVLAQRFDT